MENQHPSHDPSQWLSADRPIRSKEEDALGRRGFADGLAKGIRRWTGRESLVIALYGAWGSGKSSVKNMVIESLGESEPKLHVVDFNPWQHANRPSLCEAFFDELGIALGKGDLGTRSQKRSTLSRLRRLARRLQGGRDLADAIRSFLGIPLICVGSVALWSSWAHPRLISTVLAGLCLVAGLLSFVGRLTEAVIKFLEAGIEVGEQSLEEIKRGLAEDLRRLKTPILFALDDIDRLTPPEIIEVFQLIKTNGDFPNLIYLILCDRELIEPNITKVLQVPGRDYMEKIVQVAFDVPMIDVARVHKVLFNRLDSVLSIEVVSRRFDSRRWANVFWAGLHLYFRTLRDVNRFISTFAFHISFFNIDGAFEVNPIDLIVVETIRLFEPDVYKALRSSKELLIGGRPDGARGEAAKEALKAIVEQGSKGRRKGLAALIKALFPTAEWAFEGMVYTYSPEYGETWYRDLRVCSARMFDRYFMLSVSEEELSQADVQRLLGARGNRERFRSELEVLHSRGLLVRALDELGVHSDEIDPAEVGHFITAIFDVGDFFSGTKRGMFEVPISWRIATLVREALNRLDSVELRIETLIHSIDSSNSVGMAAEVAAVLCDRSEKESEQSFFPDAEAGRVRESVVAKIKEFAASNALRGNPRIAMLLHLWRKWGVAEDVAAYLESLVQDQRGLLQLLKSLVVRTVSHEMGEYVEKERYYVRRDDVEPLVSMNKLNEAAQKIPAGELDEEGRRAIECLKKAITRRDLGRPDDGPFIED